MLSHILTIGWRAGREPSARPDPPAQGGEDGLEALVEVSCLAIFAGSARQRCQSL